MYNRENCVPGPAIWRQTKAAISNHTISRMAMYYRGLNRLNSQGVRVVSSAELGKEIGINSTLIRKDFSCFGEFGRKGVGYQVNKLITQIRHILGYDFCWKTALVGQGVPLMPVQPEKYLLPPGFQLAALFDLDARYWGFEDDGMGMKVEAITELEDIIKERFIVIGLIAVAAENAQYVANRFLDAGITAIGNLSLASIVVPEEVSLVQMNYCDGLTQLSYSLQRSWQQEIVDSVLVP